MPYCTICRANLKPENEARHMRNVHPTVPFTPSRTETEIRIPMSSASKRRVAIVGIVVVVLVLAGWMLTRNLGTGPTDPSALQVHISMAGWNPKTLTTIVGVPLKIEVQAIDNAHGEGHDFGIDELGVYQYIGTSGSKVVTLPADQTGTYTFWCNLCCGGKTDPLMQGTYIIKA